MDEQKAAPSFDYVGRISKPVFVVITSVLYGIVLVCLVLRIFIRLQVQRQFSLDDALIIVGVLLMSAGIGMLHHFKDEMYLAEAFITNDRRVQINGDSIEQFLDFGHLGPIALALGWCAINMVKLSFLVLFKRLINRLRPMVIYWWIVLVYTILVWGLGISAYFAACSGKDSVLELLTCISSGTVALQVRIAIAQLTLDIVGDILIVAIPVKLIWQVKVRLAQKLALFLSLGLSVLLVAVTITRASGLLYHGVLDVTWETFWQYVSAEVGLILSTTTAFRAFFVARQHSAEREQSGRADSTTAWYRLFWNRLNSLLSGMRSSIQSARGGKTSSGSQEKFWTSSTTSAAQVEEQSRVMGDLPKPANATITGIRSLIDRSGREIVQRPSGQIMTSQTWSVNHEEQQMHQTTVHGQATEYASIGLAT